MPKQQSPTVVVAAVVVQGNRVLLAKRSSPDNEQAHLRWECPGGKLEEGETPEEALVREIREELAVHVDVGSLLPWPQVNYWRHTNGRITQNLILPFRCTGAMYPKPQRGQGVVDAKFFHVHEIEKMHRNGELLPGTVEFVTLALAWGVDTMEHARRLLIART